MTQHPETIYRGGGPGGNHLAHLSAGGILLKYQDQVFQVFLLKEDDQADGWNFPRGTMSDRGDLVETVLREVEEEAGYQSTILAYLGSVLSSYHDQQHLINKTTLYHVLAPTRKLSDSYAEHIDGQWMAVDQVAFILRKNTGRENEAEIWQTFLAWLSSQDKQSLIDTLAKHTQD